MKVWDITLTPSPDRRQHPRATPQEDRRDPEAPGVPRERHGRVSLNSPAPAILLGLQDIEPQSPSPRQAQSRHDHLRLSPSAQALFDAVLPRRVESGCPRERGHRLGQQPPSHRPRRGARSDEAPRRDGALHHRHRSARSRKSALVDAAVASAVQIRIADLCEGTLASSIATTFGCKIPISGRGAHRPGDPVPGKTLSLARQR